MYQWELDDAAHSAFAALPHEVRAELAAFMDAVVIVDPIEYQRSGNEFADQSKMLRTLHFGRYGEGLVTFLIYPPDELVLVVRVQWLDE